MDRLLRLDLVNFQANLKKLVSFVLKTTFFVVALMVLITNIFLEPHTVFQHFNSTFSWNLTQICKQLTTDAL